MNSLCGRSQRSVYLLTYSRANLEDFTTRESFAAAVIDTWSSVTTSRVDTFVVCKEKHNDADTNSNEYHYHMAVKLNKKCRWLAVRNALDRRYRV